MTELMELLILLSIIILGAKAGAVISNRLGQPAVLGELLVGLILGPTVLNILHWPIFTHAENIEIVVKNMAELGVILLMFLAGFETDIKEMRRVGAAALGGGVGGVILPLFFGTWLSLAFGFSLPESVFIGTTLTATSVSITAQTLIELRHLRSKEGTAILGSAVVDDILGIIILSLVVAFYAGGGGLDASSIGLIFLRMAGFFVVSILIGVFLFEGLTEWVKRMPASEILFAFALVLGLFYSFAAEALGGVAAITGAYIAGLLLAQTPSKHFVEERLKITAYGFFVPIFFVSIGLEANALAAGGSATILLFTVLIILVAVITKIVGSGLGTLLTGFKPMEALRVGTGMVSRGEVALIVANIGLRAGVITEGTFSILIVMTLFTTLVTPVLLRMVFPEEPERRRPTRTETAAAEGE